MMKLLREKSQFYDFTMWKNVGSLIIFKTGNNILMKENLEANNVTYKILPDNPLETTIEKINNSLKSLFIYLKFKTLQYGT